MNEETIFVSIASYRDKKCTSTVEHLFKMAQFPRLVFVGLCIQNKVGDPICKIPYPENVRVIHMDYKQARGPTFARYLCSTLFQNENYFMQIDSHCLFVKHWDTLIIRQLKSVLPKSPKPILSHYPPIYSDIASSSNNNRVTVIKKCFFNNHGILSFHGAEIRESSKEPTRNAFIAAGFFFSQGHLLKEVPFDPHLPYLFTGEEILLSIRFFTHGYDVYSPNQNILFHDYIRKNEPKFWDDHVYDMRDVHEKVKIIMGIHSDLSKIKDEKIRASLKDYGIGTVRTLDDFYQFIGVDIKNHTISEPSIEFYTNTQHASWMYVLLIIFILIWLLCLFLCTTFRE